MTELRWLDSDSLDFPPSNEALTNPNGLLAVGGDLTPARLVAAYRRGIFPWYEQGQPLLWWSPDPRTVLLPSSLHISRSMGKFLRQTRYTVTFDRDFAAVISACAEPRDYTDATWITADMQQAYMQLHQWQVAHSVEVWDGDELIGGLYGVALGKVFFGESMFSRRSNASKTGFIALVLHLQERGCELIDCQMPTDHLHSLGASTLSRKDFVAALGELCNEQVPTCWQAMPRQTEN
ncbi:leucyl/phenylalanyl-tRNA--protein transferase [Halopseudomonas litoralis]|uniref:Leucyl/phenylalanyl-tRNA--protein transferase n=1 Tax=Halopseudomonas litoralis TaxID=797277 RepID=A0A1H1RH55_9GAMM|nr:leucyl/phenylalanyl-tRNA--protein transferase [Halopseudomonas litoralis]SDS34983.1 leucyl/phenylalanyl-tRNA--protein transferase [Halopseudomonas litoralis]